MSRTILITLLTLFISALLALAPAPATAIEDYPRYQPATKCSPRAKPGTVELARWLVQKYGGRRGPIARSCGGSTSEHTEGRAVDWMLDADRRSDRQRAQRFLDRVFGTDARGHTDALARRMGIMYVIWRDRMYAAWDGYRPKPYLSSSCPSRRKCSKTLRHRDHVHVSLTRRAARGHTSWYRR